MDMMSSFSLICHASLAGDGGTPRSDLGDDANYGERNGRACCNQTSERRAPPGLGHLNLGFDARLSVGA
jgi:hypothetical protein